MSAKFVRRFVELFIAIFMFGVVTRFIRVIGYSYHGLFSGSLAWPVQAGAIGEMSPLGSDASVSFTDGILIVPDQPIAHALQLSVFAATSVIFIIALLVLRKVLVRFGEGEFVTDSNTSALRRIGLLLLASCALSVLQALILQPIILSAVTMPEGMILHPSISWDVKGMTNIWLHYDVPLFTFTLGGLALLFAEVFRVGTAYREDSESVV